MKKAIPIILIYLIIGYFCARHYYKIQRAGDNWYGEPPIGLCVVVNLTWPITYPMYYLLDAPEDSWVKDIYK